MGAKYVLPDTTHAHCQPDFINCAVNELGCSIVREYPDCFLVKLPNNWTNEEPFWKNEHGNIVVKYTEKNEVYEFYVHCELLNEVSRQREELRLQEQQEKQKRAASLLSNVSNEDNVESTDNAPQYQIKKVTDEWARNVAHTYNSIEYLRSRGIPQYSNTVLQKLYATREEAESDASFLQNNDRFSRFHVVEMT